MFEYKEIDNYESIILSFFGIPFFNFSMYILVWNGGKKQQKAELKSEGEFVVTYRKIVMGFQFSFS